MAGEGSTPILKIPVDLQEWDAFIDSWNHYNAELEKHGDAWAGTNRGIRQTKVAFDDVDRAFSDLVKVSLDPKFSSSTSGVFTRLRKDTAETERSWRNISKTIERSSKDLSGLVRDGSKFSGLLGLLGLGGAMVGAGTALIGATKSADDSLADQNILNRKLGLKPGEEAAFVNTYRPVGGDDALLHRIASAQANQSQWKNFMALGITPNQITGMDPAHLAAEVLRRGGEKFNALGANTGLWADSTGVSSLMDVNSMRLAGSYQGQFGDMGKQFEQLTPKLAQQQQDLDNATAARQKIDAAWTEDVTKMGTALLPLNDGFIQLAGEVTDTISAFAGSGELKKDLDEVSEGFADVARTLKQLGVINDGTKSKDSGLNPAISTANDWGKEAGDWMAKHVPGFSSMRDSVSGAVNSFTGADTATGTTGDRKAATPDQILDAIRQNESGGRAGAVNPASGAAGLYGLMPENARGINVDDPVASRKVARKILDDQLRAFNGDLPKALAGYDGDTHVAADSKKYGDMWLKGAKQETIDYLKKIENQGIDIGLTPEQQKYVDAHTTAKATRAGLATPFDDPRAVAKAKAVDHQLSTDPQIVSFTDADQRAKDADDKSSQQVVTETLLDRLKRGFGMIGQAITEGGGSQFRADDRTQQRIARQGNQPMTPYQIQVVVTSPAGSSTTVTTGGLAQ